MISERQHLFLQNQPQTDIYCDYLCVGMLQYYLGFKRDNYVKNINTLRNPNSITDAFIVDGGSRGELHWTVVENLRPEFLDHPPENWKIVKRIPNARKILDSKHRDITIYYAPP